MTQASLIDLRAAHGPRWLPWILLALTAAGCASDPTGPGPGDDVDGDTADLPGELQGDGEDLPPSDVDTSPDGDADGADIDTQPSCSEGLTRCNGSAFERCTGGSFTLVEQCAGAASCIPSAGCAQCDPAQPTVCKDGNVHACTADGVIGALQQQCVTEPCYQGRCGDAACAPETQFIYVIDDEYNLLRFDPTKSSNRFTLLAEVDCPASSSWSGWGNSTATPFSMSVDRNANAWVLYTSGEIFEVDPETGDCTDTGFNPGSQGFELFGMGFVSDSATAATEKLYISGGSVDDLASGDFGVVDPHTLAVQVLGPLPSFENSPELTGTGNAKLFAYFPGYEPVVAEIRKNDGGIVQQWELPSQYDDIVAWAFATWGGDFYIFETADTYDGYDSRVLRYDPESDQTVELESSLPWIIVGAGVSTCAPWN